LDRPRIAAGTTTYLLLAAIGAVFKDLSTLPLGRWRTTMNFNHHNDATDARCSCPGEIPMPSRAQGVIRDYPVRLRLKDRVHAPEWVGDAMPATTRDHHFQGAVDCRSLRQWSTGASMTTIAEKQIGQATSREPGVNYASVGIIEALAGPCAAGVFHLAGVLT